LPDSVAIVQSSSGTTGTAKLILVTHVNLLDLAGKLRSWLGLSPDDRSACTLPVHSGFGFKVALLAPLLTGGSVAITRTRRPEDLAEWLADLDPTWLAATPTFLHAALDALRSRTSATMRGHSLRFIASTTSYLPEAVRTGLEAALGVPALDFYGLREAGVVAVNPAPPARRKVGSAGVFWPDDVAVRDPDGEELPAGEVGEIAVRGRGVSPGYIDDLERGRDTVRGTEGFRKEWFSTGDLGTIDADGFLTIVGRTKEIINRGGEKISPYEVEKALLAHPCVREAGAFAVPHPRLGENVAAAVVLHPGTEATSAELRMFLYERLAPSRVPQQVFALDSLPRGTTGKISRSELATIVAGRPRQPVPPSTLLELEIAEIWQRLLGHADFGVDDNFFEAGGDSLLATQMLMELESAVRQALPQAELRAAYTVRHLADAVMRATLESDDLVTCARRGSRTPFFFCHGDYLNRGFYALRLADLLGRDQPVFLVHPERDFDAHADTPLEVTARAYVSRLLALRPSGAFRLGGYCNGGLLAWEIAHQLTQAGREVELVVLIETISFNARPAIRAATRALRLIARLAPARMRTRIEADGTRAMWLWAERVDPHIGRRTLDKISRAFTRAPRVTPPAEVWAQGTRALMASYSPPALDSEVACLVCEQDWGKYKYSPSAWNHLARSVRAERIPGEHVSCVSLHARDLARVLQRLLSMGDSGIRRSWS
jgi:thioesterase domain-containing protein/acyl carrier protein